MGNHALQSLLEITFQLIPVAFGYLLGLLTTIIKDQLDSMSKRKKLAAVLSLEIQSILMSAKNALEIHAPEMASAEQSLNEIRKGIGKEVSAFEIADVDFPTSVYDKMFDQLGLFDTDLLSTITELYRWISYAHHMKRENLNMGGELRKMVDHISGRTFTDAENDMLVALAGATIHYAKVYQEQLEKIITLSSSAMEMLSKISKIDPSTVSVSLSKVHRDIIP